MQIGVIIFNVIIIIIIFISRLPERLKVHWTGYHKTAEKHCKNQKLRVMFINNCKRMNSISAVYWLAVFAHSIETRLDVG